MNLALPDQLRGHFAGADHLYAVLLDSFADDLEAGGVTARICRDWDRPDPSQVVQLRLLAGVFRIVLRGDAPQLQRYYPCLGGTDDPRDCWPAFRPVVEAHEEELRLALTVAPQTNEVGRSAPLALGLFEAVRRAGLHRIRLLEPGASAGLNLLVDRFRVVGLGWSWGPDDSPLVLDTSASGVRPEPVDVVQRRGCDLEPVDASTPSGALRLTSFVWPWQLDRHARLAAALRVARDDPIAIDRAPASAWLADQLARPTEPDVLTVVWQSITRQYWPASEMARVDEVVSEARTRMLLAYISLEFPAAWARESAPNELPELQLDGELLAYAHFHGIPVTLA